MDAERSRGRSWGSLLFKENEEILFYIKSHGCDAHFTIEFHSARRFSRVDARKLLKDQLARVVFVLVTGLMLSSDEYPRSKLIGRSSYMVNGEDLASRPGKVAPAKLLLAKGFEPL